MLVCAQEADKKGMFAAVFVGERLACHVGQPSAVERKGYIELRLTIYEEDYCFMAVNFVKDASFNGKNLQRRADGADIHFQCVY